MEVSMSKIEDRLHAGYALGRTAAKLGLVVSIGKLLFLVPVHIHLEGLNWEILFFAVFGLLVGTLSFGLIGFVAGFVRKPKG